jgi:transposase-like protein
MSLLDRKYFKDEKSAFAHLEAILWADGVVCPHCGTVDQAGRLNGVKDKAGRVRPGLWKCYSKGCRKQFTVKVGTVFQCAHIPLHKMLQAVHLICSSKKGISAHQLHRTLEVDYKSAWFLAHRIREAMRTGSLAPMGGTGGVIEVDETYIGRRQGTPAVRNIRDKNMVMTLVERGGSARSFHLDGMAISDIMPILRENVARESRVNTDEAKSYYDIGKEYAGHDTVNHGREEYVRYTRDPKYIITTNTVEGYYSIFKRGMKGVYQHCKEKHLHRYLAEFDFRYSNRITLGMNDESRSVKALKGIAGKRLTYRWPSASGQTQTV